MSWAGLKTRIVDRNRFSAMFFKVSSFEMYMRDNFMKAKYDIPLQQCFHFINLLVNCIWQLENNTA
jgi:hypothetical protein